MAQSPKSGPASGDIEQQLKIIRDDVSKLAKLVTELGEEKLSEKTRTARAEVEGLLNRSRKLADDTTDKARKTVGTVEDYISEKPVQATIIALIVGMLIGSFSRR